MSKGFGGIPVMYRDSSKTLYIDYDTYKKQEDYILRKKKMKMPLLYFKNMKKSY
jgi:hypothetical protein